LSARASCSRDHAAVEFHAEHEFSAGPAALLGAMTEPTLHLELKLPDLSLPELVSHEDDGIEALLSLRYRYLGELDALGRRLLGDEPPTWTQEVRVDRSAGRGHLGVRAEVRGEGLDAMGTFVVLEAQGGCRRLLDGELRVSLPLIGHSLERRLVGGLLDRLEVESEALEQHLRH
jgi:hypothetical protein